LWLRIAGASEKAREKPIPVTYLARAQATLTISYVFSTLGAFMICIKKIKGWACFTFILS
jgi:hypothetical protein